MRFGHKTRVSLIGVCAVLVALIATAFAVGGSSSSASQTNGLSADTSFGSAGVAAAPGLAPLEATKQDAVAGNTPLAGAPAPDVAARSAVTAPEAASGGGSSSSDGDSAKLTHSGSSLEASRIIKTGNLTLRVPKLAVKETTQKLVTLAAAQGGYVSGSNASLDSSNPYGEVVLRIPVAHFQDAIDAAQKLGKNISLTTSADDVTGKYVDLAAKKHALERTRSTYLTILSRARTIGETLAVQQRIDDVQQQIDQLHGQLKLLGSQTSYSTLTVDVVASGVQAFAAKEHKRHGIGKAWHDSWSRFDRGVNAIVGAIGPIVFAVLLLGLFALIGWGGYRGIRRISARTHASV